LNQRVKLEEIFASPVTIRLLDTLLEKPQAVWTQSALVDALDADPASIRTALRHLEGVGVVEVYVDPAMGFMKAISLHHHRRGIVDFPSASVQRSPAEKSSKPASKHAEYLGEWCDCAREARELHVWSQGYRRGLRALEARRGTE